MISAARPSPTATAMHITMILAVNGNSREVLARSPSRKDPETTQPTQPAISGAAAALHHLSGEAMRMLGTSDFLSRLPSHRPPRRNPSRNIASEYRVPQTGSRGSTP